MVLLAPVYRTKKGKSAVARGVHRWLADVPRVRLPLAPQHACQGLRRRGMNNVFTLGLNLTMLLVGMNLQVRRRWSVCVRVSCWFFFLIVWRASLGRAAIQFVCG